MSQDNNAEMYSFHNEENSFVVGTFIGVLKKKNTNI